MLLLLAHEYSIKIFEKKVKMLEICVVKTAQNQSVNFVKIDGINKLFRKPYKFYNEIIGGCYGKRYGRNKIYHIKRIAEE